MDNSITSSTLAEYLFPLDTKKMLQDITSLGLDKYTKKLDSITFTQLLVFAQVHQVPSLSMLSRTLTECRELQSELSIDGISQSQLSRKLAGLDSKFLDAVFEHSVKKVVHTIGVKKTGNSLGRIHLIDSSTVTMCLSQYPWAHFKHTKAGVKLHLRLVFVDGQIHPDKAILTPAKPSDRSQMDHLVVYDPDALYLFDRGYVDYRKFDEFCQNHTRFITRLRDKASIGEVCEERPIPEGSPVTRDAVIQLGSSFRNMNYPARLIETQDSVGSQITLLTNDLNLSAAEIGDLYRKRWQIELFFKWMKQHLKVKSLYGKSENAVYNQIRVALITFCLLVLLQLKVKHQGKLLHIYIGIQLYWAKTFDEFLGYVNRKPSRNSCGRTKVDHERNFAQILQQYEDGAAEHLDDLEYDPLI